MGGLGGIGGLLEALEGLKVLGELVEQGMMAKQGCASYQQDLEPRPRGGVGEG